MVHSAVRRALAGPLEYVLSHGNLPHTPYIFQAETLRSLYSWLMKLDSSHRAHICHATGLGKTVEFSIIIKACEHLRVLVVEPGKSLVSQTAKELVQYAQGSIAHASSLKDINDDQGNILVPHWKSRQHDVLVTTDDSLKLRYAEFQSEINPGLIVCDECHWLYTDAAQNALAAFPEAVILGFTATPDYLTTAAKPQYVPVTLDNGQVLYCPPNKMARAHFGDLIDERGVNWGIQNNWLTPLAWGQIGFKFSLEDVPTTETEAGYDYDPRVLAEVMRKNWPFVIDTIRKLYRTNQYDLINRYSAAICPGVEEAVEIAQALRTVGIKAECVTGSTSDAERDRILNSGKHGMMQFLSSVFVLREGWNDKRVEVAMMLRPTKSRILYMQFMGRVLRKLAGKIALVLDPHYQNTHFAPLSAPALFGSPGQQFRSGDFLALPVHSKGHRMISPFIHGDLSKLHPVLTVQPLEIEYWAGEDGTFTADSKVWATFAVLQQLLGLTYTQIKERIEGCRNRPGRDRAGRSEIFYAVAEVKAACCDLFALPKAGPDGTFVLEGETRATIDGLSNILGIDNRTLQNRLARCGTVKGFDSMWKERDFYALSDAKDRCADLLKKVPQAGRDGTFQADGEEWGTLESLARVLWVNPVTLRKRLPADTPRREGRTPDGRLSPSFLPLSWAQHACADLLEKRRRRRKI